MKLPTDLTRQEESEPKGRPPRDQLLADALAGTGRTFVPVRRAFLQLPPGASSDSRGALLAKFTRKGTALDAYLLIHALASSSAPHVATYPAATWAQLARLEEAASSDAAKVRWSKTVAKLERLKLVERERKGNMSQYRLLHESGDGSAYQRPTDGAHGNWLKLPHAYWLDGFDAKLSHPEKLMLLIALDQQDEFKLPFDRAEAWYGIAEMTARRGLRGLADKGLLHRETTYKPSLRSPSGWAQEFRYTLKGAFSREAVEQAQLAFRGRRPDEAGEAR